MDAVNCKELPLTVPPFARTSSPLLTLSELELEREGADWNVRIPLLWFKEAPLTWVAEATVNPILLTDKEGLPEPPD